MPRHTANTDTAEEPKTRKSRSRGPMTFYVKYKVVDRNGTELEGARAEFVEVVTDKKSFLESIAAGQRPENIMIVRVPLKHQAQTEAASEAIAA